MESVTSRGLSLSRMTLGTVQLGMDYGVANTHGKPSADEAFAILDTAVQGGVTCLDTARLYGDSEQVIGSYLAARQPGPLTIVTKFWIDPAGDTTPKGVARQIRDSVDTSRRLLGLEQLPLLMLHRADDIPNYSPALPDTLRALKAEGLIEQVGVSVYDGPQIDRMLADDLYEAVQLPMNLFDARLVRSGHLERLRRAGVTVFVRSVFLQGLFFMAQMPPAFKQASVYVEKLHHIAQDAGRSVGELALVYMRDLPGVASLVLGAETPQQVAENLALFQAPPLAPALREKLSQLAGEVPIEAIMAELLAK